MDEIRKIVKPESENIYACKIYDDWSHGSINMKVYATVHTCARGYRYPVCSASRW